jgi:hypothetical protein
VNDFFPKNREIATENSFFKVFFSKWKKFATENEIKITACVHVVGVFHKEKKIVMFFLFFIFFGVFGYCFLSREI